MKILKLILCIVILNFSCPCNAQVKLKELYHLMEKESLDSIVEKLENNDSIDTADIEKLKMLGITYHNLAVLNVKDASRKSVFYLQKVYSLSALDQEVKAYLGSATTMLGRDSWNVLAKMSIVNKGIKMMDDALLSSPDSIVARMVRAKNSLDLPDLFNRKVIAKKDFQYLEKLITKTSLNVDSDMNAEIFYQLGMFYRQENNDLMAKEYFKKAFNASSDSPWGKKSEGNLRP